MTGGEGNLPPFLGTGRRFRRCRWDSQHRFRLRTYACRTVGKIRQWRWGHQLRVRQHTRPHRETRGGCLYPLCTGETGKCRGAVVIWLMFRLSFGTFVIPVVDSGGGRRHLDDRAGRTGCARLWHGCGGCPGRQPISEERSH